MSIIRTTAFYAYSSHLPAITYTIKQAVETINSTLKNTFEIKTWEDMNVQGKNILDEILAEIDIADIFICDLTDINNNVLFELGYAIGNNKKILITIDDTILDTKQAFSKELFTLSTIGYINHSNSEKLAKGIKEAKPFNDLDNTIYNNTIKPLITTKKEPTLLYLKPPINTEEANILQKNFKSISANIPILVDDPEEVLTRPLEWYIENTYNSYGIIGHFLDQNREKRYPHNSKCALICGLALGLNRKSLILAHQPYEPEIDYRDMMQTHKDASECLSQVEKWIISNQDSFNRLRKRSRRELYTRQKNQFLKEAEFGEYVAENEEKNLQNYFIETNLYRKVMNNELQYLLCVGRKGMGKTANFFQLHQALQDQYKKKNYVCLIKPIDYELQEIIRLFQINIPSSAKKHIVENLWKFLIYTELSKDIYHNSLAKSVKQEITEVERKIIDFVDKHNFIQSDFSIRLETAIKDICNANLSNKERVKNIRDEVSQLLHDNIISDLRILIGDMFQDYDKVFILIDNLDKSWQKGSDLEILSEFLFGLLGVGQRISNEFHRSDSRRNQVNLTIIAFLRSDIFFYIKSRARERDKLLAELINWNDHILLQNLIEARMIYNSTDLAEDESIWEKFFVSKTNNIPTKDFLVQQIIPRPRDIIFLCKQALNNAIKHSHTVIQEDDIKQAMEEYSKWAWAALLSELEPVFSKAEALLIEFAGAPEVIDRSTIEDFCQEVEIPLTEVDEVIDLLCDMTFLGIETSINSFEYIYDPEKKKVLNALAKKVIKSTNKQRYRIHTAFHSYLSIQI